jgi:hypothetical protein
MKRGICELATDGKSKNNVRAVVLDERRASLIRVTRISEVGKTLALTSNRRTMRRNTRSSQRASVAIIASVVPSSPILVTLMKEALSSSETSVLTSATWRNIPEDTILHSHRREILRSYILDDIEEWRILGSYAVWLL